MGKLRRRLGLAPLVGHRAKGTATLIGATLPPETSDWTGWRDASPRYRACLLAGTNLARRQAILAVADGRLLIVRIGPFGSKRLEWLRDEIATIGIGDSGSRIQGVPVVELQVQPIDSRRLAILAERDRTELDWLATTLRRELQVPPPYRLVPSNHEA